jgi:ribose-phosphate pyrophosphokinase
MIRTESELAVFAGTTCPQLSTQVAKTLGVTLGAVSIKRFADGETSVLIEESVRGKDVFVIQSTSTPVNDSTMELVLLIDALKRASAGRITAVVPYYGYSRQDRLVGRSPISARIVADFICAGGANAFVSVDLHSHAIEGFFNIPVDNLSAIPLFASHFKEKFGQSAPTQCVVVSPDVGGVKRARNLARMVGCPLAIIDKQRHKHPGNSTYTGKAQANTVIGDVEGRSCIMMDDLVDTAGSLTAASQALIDSGAKDVYAAATHGVLSPPAFTHLEESPIKEIVFTDSIPVKMENAPAKVKLISLAPLLAETIKRQHTNQSVAGLSRE